MQHGIQRAQLGGVDAQRAVAGGAGDEYAAALARLDDAVLAQPRHRFADHGATDAELFGQRGFGGQLVAGLRAAFLDFGEQALGDRVGQGGRRVWGTTWVAAAGVGGSAPSVWQAGRPGYAQ